MTKMRKISKKTIKRIKEGYHDDLMESIEFLIDTYNEEKFDAGYRSSLNDIRVLSGELAEKIIGVRNTASKGLLFNYDTISKIIEEFFTNEINKNS